MNSIIHCIFWLSLFLVVYTYAIYPLVLYILVKLFNRNRIPQNETTINDDELPSLGIIIAAFNEEKDIQARVENIFACDYPQEKIHLYIGSDGSSDNTNDILRKIDDPRLKAHLFEENRGKPSVLNDLVGASEESILVFSDANTYFEADALKKLARHFTGTQQADAVCGQLKLLKPDGVENEDNLYWKYENWLKVNESKIGCLLGANGAIYAIRREDYIPISSDSIIDDFVIVNRLAAQGKIVDYDAEAIAKEYIPDTIADEFKRRTRIGRGNYQTLFRYPNFLFNSNVLLGFSYLSHKVLRWLVPHSLIIAFVSNAFLLHVPFYVFTFMCQLFVYALFLGWKKGSLDVSNSKLLRLMIFWLDMNYALWVGFVQYFSGSTGGAWTRTAR